MLHEYFTFVIEIGGLDENHFSQSPFTNLGRRLRNKTPRQMMDQTKAGDYESESNEDEAAVPKVKEALMTDFLRFYLHKIDFLFPR